MIRGEYMFITQVIHMLEHGETKGGKPKEISICFSAAVYSYSIGKLAVIK